MTDSPSTTPPPAYNPSASPSAYTAGLAERKRLCQAYQEQLVNNMEIMADLLDILWPSQSVRASMVPHLNEHMSRVLHVGAMGLLDTVDYPAPRRLDDLHGAQRDAAVLSVLCRVARLVKRRELGLEEAVCLDIEHQGWCVLLNTTTLPTFRLLDGQ
jgi:hypothetical protein